METIPFAVPYIGAEEEEAVLRVLRSGWLTTGPETQAFEQEFAASLGVLPQQVLAVNSATAGLHLALEACGVRKGDLVFVPSYTFAASAEVVRYLQADIVFVDCAPGSFLMDIDKLEESIDRLSAGKRAYGWRGGAGPCATPKVILPVHYAGLCCDMQSINALAKRYRLRVVEDAAHAFPAYTVQGTPAGTQGDLGVFSFYATKPITTGEGGMIVCGTPAYAERIAIMRSHGIDRTVWNRYTDTKASWYYQVIDAGYKYNIPDILSALGRVQLSRAPALAERRKKIAALYDAAFETDEHFIIPPTAPGDARHLYPLRLCEPLDRDSFITDLKERGIGVSVHFIPLHTMPYYKKLYSLEDDDFPESYRNFRQEISLPIWPAMTDAQINRVISCIQELAARHCSLHR
jgi:dTDP-4-amino-4,6-dideoxygalactose transaminase